MNKSDLRNHPLRLLTVKDVSELLGRTETSVRNYIRQYHIPCLKRGAGWHSATKIYILQKDFENFLLTQWDNRSHKKKKLSSSPSEEPKEESLAGTTEESKTGRSDSI